MRARASTLAFSALLGLLAQPAVATEDVLDLVDPMIGTMGSGFVFPGPAAPYGMVQLSPDTEGPFAFTGYQYIDRKIRGFSHVHTQSMGVWEGGEVPVMPTTGEVVTDVKRYQQSFSHATETAEVGWYEVLLANRVRAELTAGLRTGMHRYTYPPNEYANVIIDAGRAVGGSSIIGPDLENDPGRVWTTMQALADGTIVGTVRQPNPDTRQYIVHFAIRSDTVASEIGAFASRGGAPQPGQTSVTGVGAGMYMRFAPLPDGRVVRLMVGISFVDTDGAVANLEDEFAETGFDLEARRDLTRDAWRTELDTIRIEGGDRASRTSFYTALYHAQHHPNIFQDADGRYRGYDRQVHQIGAVGDPMPEGSDYYANFSMWDTYRTQMPLLSWIQPDRYADMLRSLSAVAEQGGRLPHWGWMDRYADFMNGTPAFPVIADGVCRGVLGDDPSALDRLYAAARRMAFQEHRDPVYLSKGYVPADIGGPGTLGSGAASTLEYAANDHALALVADRLGRQPDANALFDRAQNWRKVFDPETRFARPRNADGTWVGDPYLPEMPDGWREGTGWQYTMLVPHDPAGLFEAMGTDGEVQQRLDTFFSLPALLAAPHATSEFQQKITAYGIAYYGNQYAPSNEHDLQAPWLYAYTGSAWKTQAAVRGYQTLYRPTPDGLPGNDDLGTMSAWFVWSAMGLYPTAAGAPVYTLATPLFERIEIDPVGVLPSTIIEAPGATWAKRFVSTVGLGGEQLGASVKHRDLLGETLRFEVSELPMLAQSVPPPPSASTDAVSEFGCQ
ncbi:MAG: GH92 family glycosyl hydrolase [Actinomycetota bacterium]